MINKKKIKSALSFLEGGFIYFLIVLCLFLYINLGIGVVRYPVEIDYGEGIVLQQFMDFIAGEFMLSPLEEYPYYIYHYPPVYYAVTYIIHYFVNDAFMSGRIASFLSGIGIILSLFYLIYLGTAGHSLKHRILGASLGSSLITCSFSFIAWTLLMRVDTVGIFLGLLAMICAWKALSRPFFVYICAILLVLTVFTKQTLISPAIASIALLLIYRPRLAIRCAIICIVLGILGLLLIHHFTNGEGLKHMFLYNLNPHSFEKFLRVIKTVLARDLPIAPAILCIVLSFLKKSILSQHVPWRVKKEPPRMVIFSTVYILSSFLIFLLTASKEGASYNYFLETLAGVCWLIGLSLTAKESECINTENQLQTSQKNKGVLKYIVTFCFMFGVALTIQVFQTLQDINVNRYQNLKQRLSKIKAPVHSEDMTLLVQAGHKVPFESAITSSLIRKAVFDEEKIIGLIEDRTLNAIVTINHQRFLPNTINAIERCYSAEETVVSYKIHLPRTKCVTKQN